MFVRLLIAVVLVVVALALVRHVRVRLRQRPRPLIDSKTGRCELCDVYIPLDEAVVRGKHTYCSVAHADEGDQ